MMLFPALVDRSDSFVAPDIAAWRELRRVLMMYGFMFIEIESLDELKLLTSGNGLVLFEEERFACNVVVVEALEDLAGIACEKKNAKRRRKILGDGIIAMKLLLLHEQ